MRKKVSFPLLVLLYASSVLAAPAEVVDEGGFFSPNAIATANQQLSQIKQPTLLVWGNNDTVTPPFVAREFQRLIPNSELHFIDKCGHAPMMEVPEEFNVILHKFLKKLAEPATVA